MASNICQACCPRPTSGLDYSTAKSLVRLIGSLAHDAGTPIMCTIHQPPADVFDMFDSFTLLCGGRVACSVNLNVNAMGAHLAAIGCPLPADSTLPEHAVDYSEVLAAAWATSELGLTHEADVKAADVAGVGAGAGAGHGGGDKPAAAAAAAAAAVAAAAVESGGSTAAALSFGSALAILLKHRLPLCYRDKKGFLARAHG